MAYLLTPKCPKLTLPLNQIRCFAAKKGPYKVVMVRHGESEFNQKNLFCGWYDAHLTDKGRKEAASAGKALKDCGYEFDIAYTSVLARAHETLCIIFKVLGQKLPVQQTWRLNERHYGALTGLNKADTAQKYGEKQVQLWRRSFDVPPPAMDEKHPYYNRIVCDPVYRDGPPLNVFPMFESLKLTIERTLPFWNEKIVPTIKLGKKVIIVAHGNSLRGIVKHLDQLSNEKIMELNLPTGIPFVYVLDENMKPLPEGSLRFLGDPETVKKAMETVKKQGKAK